MQGVLRGALANAVLEELISKNVAQNLKLRVPRRKPTMPWTVEEARRFLVTAQEVDDPFYAAYVLILVLGLRRGEVLALRWQDLNLDAGELTVSHGLQRINGQLVLGETKTVNSDAVLPLPEICVTASRLQEKTQATAKASSGPYWTDGGLVFSTDHGTPIDPRNFVRASSGCVIWPRSGRSGSTTPATPVRRCWLRSTYIRGWRCRSCGIARSP